MRPAGSERPLQPFQLASRVGSLAEAEDPWAFYDWLGRDMHERLVAALPDGYSLEGRKVLDFGCGAGRTLRHFIDAEPTAELLGCDIDAPSIDWVQEHLSPPVHAFRNDESPPLRQPDDTFDVIYCVSVFTHLARSWSAWLVELHRVLKPGGLLLATFMGEGESRRIAQEDWDDDRVGMLILNPGQPWDAGGPMIMHSPWWIREHWGRLFEVVSLSPHAATGSQPPAGHGIVTLRKTDVRLTPADLERPSDDPREARALAHAVDRLARELEMLRPALAGTSADLAVASDRVRELEDELARREDSRAAIGRARSRARTVWNRLRRRGR